MTALDTKVLDTKVQEIGSNAKGYKDINMLIFFGNNAPDLLRAECYLIEDHNLNGKIEPGMTLKIGDNEYKITAVGKEVNQNVGALGHTAVNFTGDTEAELPGSLYVESKPYPNINVGDEVSIF